MRTAPIKNIVSALIIAGTVGLSHSAMAATAIEYGLINQTINTMNVATTAGPTLAPSMVTPTTSIAPTTAVSSGSLSSVGINNAGSGKPGQLQTSGSAISSVGTVANPGAISPSKGISSFFFGPSSQRVQTGYRINAAQ